MRYLVLTDIHANLEALDTCLADADERRCDATLCLGDLVDYGLEPAPCVSWARGNARYTVRGNHDHGVAQNVVVVGKTGYKYLSLGVKQLVSRLPERRCSASGRRPKGS